MLLLLFILFTVFLMELITGFEPVTSSLPRKRSTPELHRLKIFRAGDRVRTGDIQLGRLTLYQLSYSRNTILILSLINVGRAGFEPAKLKNNRFTVCPRWPLEYLPYYKDRSPQKGEKFKEPMEGLEPTTC